MISAQPTAATNNPGEERLITEVYFLLTPALIRQFQSGSSPELLLHTVTWGPRPLPLSDGGDKRVRGGSNEIGFKRKGAIVTDKYRVSTFTARGRNNLFRYVSV